MIKTLLNPFEKFSEKQLLIFGILFLFIGSFLGHQFNAIFDSILHISFTNKVSFINHLLQNIVLTLILSIFLFVLGKYFNSKTRYIDILNVSLIARIPFYLTTLANINDASSTISNKLLESLSDLNSITISTQEYFILFLTSILSLVGIIWLVVLLWNGFKTATNAKTTKQIVLFILVILIANFISSYTYQLLNI
ncbi:YIP1 family protein [uncultured Flavobacterium sp.]|uniref:YIP1 family protein n=1 Tax=uncultured Flavobacterium sp. TaxID=165435 RepID=UPI0030EB36DD|tara:strand:+ start:272410 stop:272994 length:585 start_codon:yes stop_codon:yes gene_type:complete